MNNVNTNNKLLNIINSLKNKIPNLFLTIQIFIANSVYKSSTQLDVDTLKTIFYVYYPILCVFCGLWEYIHSYYNYKKKYPQFNKKKNILFSLLSSFVSIIALVAISFYINNGVPFTLFFEYEHDIGLIVMLFSFCLISLITHLEHLKCNINNTITPNNSTEPILNT